MAKVVELYLGIRWKFALDTGKFVYVVGHLADNVNWTVTRQRRHDATDTGELTTMSGSQPQARVSFVGAWFDAVGRQTAMADYGTYNDGTPTRPDSAPARSDTILVSSTAYDSAGQAYQSTDPAGKESRRSFDDAGRVTKTIDNYQDGTVSASYLNEDVTVETAVTAQTAGTANL